MEVNILKQDKDQLDVEIDNLTMVELLRVYLNDNGAKMAVWKRSHPSKPAVLHIEGPSPKALLKKAITAVEKDLKKYETEFKKEF